MPIPQPSTVYQNNIVQQLNAMANLVKLIKVAANAPAPISDMNTIAQALAAVNARLNQCNTAGQISTADRHYMGDQFAIVATELHK
jgi:hypothetical protein